MMTILEIPSLDAISKTVDDIKEPIDNIIVTGILSRTLEYLGMSILGMNKASLFIYHYQMRKEQKLILFHYMEHK